MGRAANRVGIVANQPTTRLPHDDHLHCMFGHGCTSSPCGASRPGSRPCYRQCIAVALFSSPVVLSAIAAEGILLPAIKGTRVETAWINLVGAVAATLTTSAFFPQAIKTIRTRDTSGLSLSMYALLLSGVMLWLAYGVIIGSWPLIVSNAVVLVPQSLVMAMLLRRQRAE